MADSLFARLKHGWNVFMGRDDSTGIYRPEYTSNFGYSSSRQERTRLRYTTEKSIIASIYTRISIDVSDVAIRHVRLDDKKRYQSDMKSQLNDCLTVSANLDQASRAFRKDMALSLLDKGTIAIVPVQITDDPFEGNTWDVQELRVGEIVQWYPEFVQVNLYNVKTGQRELVTLPKSMVAIPENPFYDVMNEPNSTLARLNRKLAMLDELDQKNASAKLDLIIQLPYVIKSEARRTQANQRRSDIEEQLTNSQYGIAYTDGTERITQLNRPVENNLLPQVQYLTEQLYNQLGLTVEILKGTADEATMLNYYTRTIQPIVEAIVESMHAKFLTKTARTQKQAIAYFRDPFKLVPLSQMAEIADKLARNEIASSNDIRTAIGWVPSPDPRADQLRNANMPDTKMAGGLAEDADAIAENDAVDADPDTADKETSDEEVSMSEEDVMNQMFSELEADVKRILGGDSSEDENDRAEP